MIYAVATDQKKITVASDGCITGVATLGSKDTWDTRVGIAIAVLRMYVGWRAGAPFHPMRDFRHYYVIEVNMAMMAEIIARSCTSYGIARRNRGEIAWRFRKTVPFKILSYEHSYSDMLRAIRDLSGNEAFFTL